MIGLQYTIYKERSETLIRKILLAKELISTVVPSLRPTDNGQKALGLMDVFRISHLPVVDKQEYLGLICDKSIEDLDLTEKKMGDCKEFFAHPYVFENQHIFEVVALISKLKLSVIPVLGPDHAYRGVILITELVHRFSDLVAVNEPGGIIVLELNQIDYSLAEIARLVEENDAKILSLYVFREENSKEISVTLKLNLIDLSPVIQTFVRFDYSIKAVFMDDSVIRHMYDDRYEQFMKYLNI